LASKKTCLSSFTHQRIELATRSPNPSFKQDRVGRNFQFLSIAASYAAKGFNETGNVSLRPLDGRHDLPIRKSRPSGEGNL
jgi:hypothetical protein